MKFLRRWFRVRKSGAKWHLLGDDGNSLCVYRIWVEPKRRGYNRTERDVRRFLRMPDNACPKCVEGLRR